MRRRAPTIHKFRRGARRAADIVSVNRAMKTGPPTLVRRWRGDIDGIEELETLPRQGPQMGW